MKRKVIGILFALVIVLSLSLVTSVPAMAEEDPNQPVVIAILSGATVLNYPGEQGVSGQGWDPGDVIELHINGKYVATAIAIGNAEGNASPMFDTTEWGVIKPKDKVTLVRPEDGLTKDLVVASFILLGANLEDDTIYGLAEPGANIFVFTRTSSTEPCFRFETADANGFWLADFSEPGSDPGEDTTCDIASVLFCMVGQYDNEGDMSAISCVPSETSQPVLALAKPSLLAKAYGGLEAAAEALGFDSVKELREDIRS